MDLNNLLKTREQFINWFIEWSLYGDYIKVTESEGTKILEVYKTTGQIKAVFIDGKGLTILD